MVSPMTDGLAEVLWFRLSPIVCAKPWWFNTPKSGSSHAVAKVRWCETTKPDDFKIKSKIKTKKYYGKYHKNHPIWFDRLNLFIIDLLIHSLNIIYNILWLNTYILFEFNITFLFFVIAVLRCKNMHPLYQCSSPLVSLYIVYVWFLIFWRMLYEPPLLLPVSLYVTSILNLVDLTDEMCDIRLGFIFYYYH